MPGDIRDVRMMGMAVSQRWPISQEYRSAIITRLLKVVVDPSSSKREVTAAARALLSAESQNQLDQHKLADLSSERYNDQLSSIAADLGIDPALIIDATVQAGGSPAADASSGADG